MEMCVQIATLPPNILMGMAGAQGDYAFFRDFIQANVKYHTLRTGLEMSTKAASTFIRGEVRLLSPQQSSVPIIPTQLIFTPLDADRREFT